MLRRCLQPHRPDYPNYGGRGITVCDRWLNFENFLADMGEPPPGTSLDRVDNDGPYSPQNCRWATREEQGNNTRTNARICFRGITRTKSQWARELGITYRGLQKRVKRGLPIEAILEPKKSAPVEGAAQEGEVHGS